MRFRTTLLLDPDGQGYVEVPEPLDQQFTEDRGAPVIGWANGAPFRARLRPSDGHVAVPLDPTTRLIAGDLEPGDPVTVEMEYDDGSWKAEAPRDFIEALADHPAALDAWDAMPPQHQIQWLEWIDDPRHVDERPQRLTNAVAKLVRDTEGK